jgi:hypothetical protein
MSAVLDRPPAQSPVPRQPDRGRSFISDHPLRSLTIHGDPAVALLVRLTSYRSLPLSCIESIDITVDGMRRDPDALLIVLNGTPYRLTDLASLSEVWWFILDHAELVVPLAKPLTAGAHDVEATLVTVEPYVSNGRFHFASTSTRRLTVGDSGGETR